MKKIYQYRKSVGLVLIISIILLYVPSSPMRAVMITTQYAIHQDSEQLCDRARVRAILQRADVMAQLQAYGISPEEARSRVDSLTDSEIASFACKMDRIPASGGRNYPLDGSVFMFISMALYAIIAAILIYFSFNPVEEEKPE